MRFTEKPTEKKDQEIHPAQAGVPSDSSIRKKMVLDTFQYPQTLTSLAACIIAIAYLIFLSPMFGFRLEAFVFAIIFGITAAVTFCRHYVKEYSAKAMEIFERADEKMKKVNEDGFKQLHEKLRVGFFGFASAEGLQVLAQLMSEHEQLQIALEQQRIIDPLSISLIPGLAEETFRRGLGVLSDALELMKVLQTPDRDNLKKEITEMEKDIQSLTNIQGQSELIEIKSGSLAFCKERQAIFNALRLNIEKLLYQARRCEGVLHSTRLELVTVRIGHSQSSVDAVVGSLKERIRQMKEVQEEINKPGIYK